ncbi:hypothetical protein GF391_02195 [Candidatus Uhrbacteria bacterium]|nr:hypothetical protein [Candidatus Uhrbacteria bacterium]
MRGKSKQNYNWQFITAFIPPIIIFLLHLFAINFNFYLLIPNLDVPMHFAGGMAIAVTAIQLINAFERRKSIIFKSHILRGFILISLVSFAAMLWELAEFSADVFLGWHLQYNLFDTMTDMILGMVGGAIVIISWIYGKAHQ